MKHTTKIWFSDKDFYDYFNEDFSRNKIGKLTFPKSMIKAFNGNASSISAETVNKMADSMGQSVIDTIVKKHFNLTSFDFKYLLPEHQEYLKEAVCNEVQQMVYNNLQLERRNGSSISTPSFTIGTESTGWVMTYDEFGVRTKELVALADLPNYKIVGDGFIGRIAYKTAKSEIVLYQWNNTELGKELNEPGMEGTPYDTWQHATDFIQSLLDTYPDKFPAVNKYDYIYLTVNGVDGLFRFEGGDWTKQENWDRKDVKSIDGDRYLVYRNYVLAGQEGQKAMADYLKTADALNLFAKLGDVYSKTEIDAKLKGAAGLPWLADKYADVSEFGSNAHNFEVVKYDTNADGKPNSQGIVFLVKTASGLKEFRTWQEAKQYIDNQLALKADLADVQRNTANIAQLAQDIQTIENTWTGNLLMPSNGTSDLSALQGDKGAFDFTAGKKLIITVGAMNHAVTETQILKVGTQGSYHLIGDGVDATFGVTVADTGVVTIQNFASTGTAAIVMHNLAIKEIEQNPKSVAVLPTTVYTSSKEIVDSSNEGTAIADDDTKVVNAETAVGLLNYQKEIDFKFLSEFSDELYYKTANLMEYKDKELNLPTLPASITTSGNTIAYSSLISPYDRIYQDQASFEVTLGVDGQGIEYRFTGKGKAIRFTGDAGQKYRWETLTKFNDIGVRELYIRFSGNASMGRSDDAFSPSPVWTAQSLPVDIKLTELMDATNRTALVQMTFTTIPALGTKIASIDYKTAAYFYDQRQVAIDKAIMSSSTVDLSGYYTKVEDEGKLANKADIDLTNIRAGATNANKILKTDATGRASWIDPVDSYSKTESDTKYATKTDLNAKADYANVYVKSDVDNKVNAKASLSAVYTRAQADAKFPLKTDLQSKADVTSVYTKSETDTKLSAKVSTTDMTTELAKKANLSYVNDELAKKQNNLTAEQLANINADHSVYATNTALAAKADVTYVDSHFMLKTDVITTVSPTMQMDGTDSYLLLNADTVVGDHTLGTMVDGEKVDVNFKNADSLGTVPADTVQVFVGATKAIRIPNSSGSAALKWGTKTNPTDVNVKDNFQTHNFRIEKQGDQFNFIKLVDNTGTVDKTYVDNGLAAKQDQLSPQQLSNINANHAAYLTAHQDISGKANVNLDNIAITGNVGKIPQVNSNGKFTYVDFPAAVDISGKADKTYVDTQLGTKQNTLSATQLNNINADHSRYLTAHQDISGKMDISVADAKYATKAQIVADDTAWKTSKADVGVSYTKAESDGKYGTKTDLGHKQDKLTTNQLLAVNSGITTAGVAQIETNRQEIAHLSSGGAFLGDLAVELTDPTRTQIEAAYPNTKTGDRIEVIKKTSDGLEFFLMTKQADGSWSKGGIRDYHIAGAAYNDAALRTLINSKQNSLSQAQIDAVNSGITAAKVAKIDTNAANIAHNSTAIDGKQDKLTVGQLLAINSGINTQKVAQIASNTHNIANKQDTLTKVLTFHFDNGSTEDFKVG